MALHCAGLDAVAFETSGHVVVSKPAGIEPVLETPNNIYAGGSRVPIGLGAPQGNVSLRALDDRAIGLDARMAGPTRECTELDLAFLSNDVALEREDAFGGQGHRYALVPQWIAHIGGRAERDRRVEHQLTRADPVGRRLQSGPVECDLRLSSS